MRNTLLEFANQLQYFTRRISSITGSGPFGAMRRLLAGTKEPIIFDVGAHHGYVSKTFRKIFPGSTVYAFEPFEASFNRLKANTASDDKILPFNFGLSNLEGTQNFHSNLFEQTNSLLSTDESGSQTWGNGLLDTQDVVQAEFKTIDSFVADMELPRIDLLKLDVQGAEYLVMKGAVATFKKGLVRVLYSEVITQPTYDGQKRFDEALEHFYSNGLDLFNFYNMSTTKEGRLRQVDAIFTKTNR